MTDGNDEELLRGLLRAGAADPAPGQALGVLLAVRDRVRRRRFIRRAAAGGTAACLLAGVVTAAVGLTPSHHSTTATRFGEASGGGQPTIVLTGALESFAGCSDYLSYVKAAAEAVVGPYGLNGADTTRSSFGGFATNGVGAPTGGTEAGGGASPLPANAASGSAAGVASTPTAGGASTYSHTDDQVAGVDEPDTAKTDGNVVVTLAGSVLRVLDSSAKVLGRIDVPGDTSGGFLLDGPYAIVLSTTTPSDGPIGVYNPGPYAGASTGQGSSSTPPGTAQVAIVDLSTPSTPSLLRTFVLDGELVGARLVDGQLRLVLNTNGPRIEFTTPAATGSTASATAENKQRIESSTLDQWLPSWQIERPDGSSSARTPLASCASVSRPQQSSGVATATVFSVDPSSSEPGPALSVVAGGDTVYETADQVFLAGPATSPADPQPYANAVQSGCCSIIPPASATTRIYEFTFHSSGPPTFAGAGTVPGWLINSYAMDQDSAGRLRVASTGYGGSDQQTQSYITILATKNGSLTAVGSVGGLGRGEFIRAVRFIGDLAYVVTFQSFDPLYIVDLSDPQHPTLAGHLDEPGFSEFLYPVSSTIVVGVGVQITQGEPSGYVLSTYDVSNPAKPRRVASTVLASGYQYVGQGYDPHAFLYWAPDGVAFVATPQVPSPYMQQTAANSVTAYRISAAGQLTDVATLSHPDVSADRTLVVDGEAWAVTSGGVITAPLSSLKTSTWAAYP